MTRPLSKLLLLAMLFWLGAPGAGQETEKLGRLFYSPEQRAELDRPSKAPAAEGREETADSVTLNGEIRRHGKRRARWINGSEAQESPPATPSLAVGDRYQRSTGKRQGLLGDGRLSIKQESGEQ